VLTMTNKYSVARDHIVPETEHAFETSINRSTMNNIFLSGWPMPTSFRSSDIFWVVAEKPTKTTTGYLYALSLLKDPNITQMVFFRITLTCQRKKGPWPYFDAFDMSHIYWHDDKFNTNTKADKIGSLSQGGKPGKMFSVVMKSLAYGPSNYIQLNEAMKLFIANVPVKL